MIIHRSIKILSVFTCVALAAGMSSCSLFEKAKSAFEKPEKMTASRVENTATTAPSQPTKQKVSKGKNVKQEAVLPTDREQIQTDKVTKTFNPAELAKGIVKGDWAIESVNGKKAVGEQPPFIKFVPAEKRFYGNNGCNVINGSYSYNPSDSTMSFSQIISTMMACGKEGITDYEINQALNAVRYYSWNLSESQYWLHLFDISHREVMTLMHQNFEFLNGTWAVTAIDEEPVANPDMKLVIDVEENKVHGNTGCNIINGTLDTDMDAPNSISFRSIIMTRMACDDPSRETQFVVALENAAYARPIAANKVLLIDDNGKVVLTLVRTDLSTSR